MAGISKEEIEMKKFHTVKKLFFENDRLHVHINGNEYEFELRKISKALLKANRNQRETFEISPSGYGIHWPLIDEDLSIDGLLGIRHQVPEKRKAA